MSITAASAPARPRSRAGAGGILRGLLLAPMTRRARAELRYSAVGLPFGVAGFAVIIMLLAEGTALTVSIIGAVAGLLLLAALLRVARGLGAGHRRLARTLLGAQVIAPAPFMPGTGILGRLEARLRDGAGWRAVAYLLLRLPTAIAGGYLAGILWLGGLYYLSYPLWWGIFHRVTYRVRGVRQPNPVTAPFPFGGAHIGSAAGTLLVVGLGAAALLVAPWAIRAVVLADQWLMRSLLGPGSLSERVATLEKTRAQAVDDSAALLRRLERDLHDGAQVRLAALAMSLDMAREKLGGNGLEPDVIQARDLVTSAHSSAKEAMAELRDLARGIHPPALDAGLHDALATLASRSAIPVTLTVDGRVRPTPAIETIAYFCAAELLANAAKHSGARLAELSVAEVRLAEGGPASPDRRLRLTVSDNGSGGASARPGGGLAGLAQRAGTVDGSIGISSPAGGPTVVTVLLPLHA